MSCVLVIPVSSTPGLNLATHPSSQKVYLSTSVNMILAAAVILLALAPLQGQAANNLCEAKGGKKLRTFSKTAEMIKFPCKYNALSQTTCGKWRVTLTPGNQLESERNKHFIIKSLWLGLERISDGSKWEGRTDLKIARKYMDGIAKAPFKTRDGDLKMKNIFDFDTKDDKIIAEDKDGDFKVTYGVYDPFGRWHKSSTFSFECNSKKFVPSDYPVQLCGNGTRHEVRKYKRDNDYGEDYREATLFYNVFRDQNLVQTDSKCAAIQNTMVNKCVHKGKDMSYEAANLCWPIVGQAKYVKCISGHLDNPTSAFKHCVQFVCSGFKDKDSCVSLGREIDYCPNLKDVSSAVKKSCKDDIFTKEESE